MQGAVKQLGKVTAAERLEWAHDAMMRALRLAMRNRDDRALVTAALSRAQEYDEMLAVSLAPREQQRREAIGRANKRGRPPKQIPETVT